VLAVSAAFSHSERIFPRLYRVIALDNLLDPSFEFAQGVGRIVTVCSQIADIVLVFELDFGDPSDLRMEFDTDETDVAEILLAELVDAQNTVGVGFLLDLRHIGLLGKLG